MRKTPGAPPAPPPPHAGQGRRGQAGHLAYLLRQGAGAVRLRMERLLADFDVTTAQFAVLTMLDAYPQASGADVARLALLTPQTVHGITGNLRRAGLVEAAPSAVHGRIQTLALTTAGQELLSTCKARVAALEQDLAAGLTAGEEDVIRRWLVRLALPGAA